MTITLTQMKEQLISFDDIIKRLENTEPLDSVVIDSSSRAKFRLEPDWAETAKELGMTEAVSAFVTVDGTEYQFTKEGILQATSLVGLGTAYVLKTPSNLIEMQLNYWFSSGLQDAAHKMVVVKEKASAFIKPTITTFSNVELAHSIYDGIQDFYGTGTEVLGDYKFFNSLNRTDIRFIVPRQMKIMQDTNMLDVPGGSKDVWSAGINLTNSLTGKNGIKTGIESYLFRWWCTNGAITENGDVGMWNRRTDGQSEDAVYEWAANAVEDVLGGMESLFDSVQALAYLKPKGSTSDLLNDLYSSNKVPVSQRLSITNDVVSANEVTMYSIMNAVSQQANNPTLTPERVEKLLRVGGSLPSHYFDSTKAKVFAQGQTAGPQAPNPYAMEVQ